MNHEIENAVQHLDHYGYCILPKRIPATAARAMAQDFLELHNDPRYGQFISGDGTYQTLFGMLNLDDRVWQCAFHPDTVAVARHFLGPHCRVVEACSKPSWPGAPAQSLHVDSAQHFYRVPDVPWMINSIWMLTDFTEANGATGIVPLSHCSRLSAPPADIEHDSPQIKALVGTAGSVLLWHGGVFHQARANHSDMVRVGLNIAYYPRWMNNWVEGGHQPLWPETYRRMPDEMQKLCVGALGRDRTTRYESG